jgi:glycosyltransferase involved in cell wall biosynthesis
MTQKPLITTVIPTFRRPQLLKRAILSVLRQTYPNFKICVYDNASGDSTASVVAELAALDSRVEYHCHSENVGAFDNFQFGIKRVDTQYFSLLSDDDFLLPDFYETALNGFVSYPQAMFSATDVIHVGKHGNILGTPLEKWTPGLYTPPDGLMAVLEHGHSEWTGILFRKTVLEVIGLLDRDTYFYSDVDYTLRIAARCSFVISKRPCAVFDQSLVHERMPNPFELNWKGVSKMISNIADDEAIKDEVRTLTKNIIFSRFEGELFKSGLVYISRRHPAETRKVAIVLRDEFGSWVRYMTLLALLNLCKYIPFFRGGFDAIVAIRRYLREKRMLQNQKLYVDLLTLLKE